MIKFSKKENNHGDVVCVAVMSHGMDPGQSNDRIFASDGQTIDIEKDVLATFNNISSPHLHGKPKLFYIQVVYILIEVWEKGRQFLRIFSI